MKSSRLTPIRSRRASQGVVLLYSLIVLVILLAGAAAVVRSMQGSLFMAGNLAFKRDLVNQGEQAISQVLRNFQASVIDPGVNAPANNYSAVTLRTNNQGVPLTLLTSNGRGTAQNVQNNNFTPSGAALTGTGGATVHFVIDRLCDSEGVATALGQASCVHDPQRAPIQGGSASGGGLPPPFSPIFRLSLRVDGPRDTQVFLQTSFTNPE